MSDRRRVLGRGLGALIPTALGEPERRPSDIFFNEDPPDPTEDGDDVSRETSSGQPALSSVPAGGDVADASGIEPSGASVGATELDEAHASVPSLRPVPGVELISVPVDAIRPNPRQPRTAFDEDELAELAHSIQEIGLLQPIIVRPVPADEGMESEQFELVVGERRWRAAALADLTEIPALRKDTSDDALLRDALLENLHRSQLNPLDEASAYQQLLDDFDCTHEDLADRLGRSRSQISNTIRLLRLPPAVARRVAAGVLSAGHARALLGLTDGAMMERLAQRIVAEGLSVRAVEEIVAVGDGHRPKGRTPAQPRAGSAQMEDLSARLADRLETNVKIVLGRRKGRLTLDFASTEDLDRILGALGLEELSVARDEQHIEAAHALTG